MISYGNYDFGQRLKSVLESRHLLPTQFAKRMGVSHGSVFRLFKMKSADLDKIRRISVVLQHDFIAEIAETGSGMKGVALLKAELELERTARAALDADYEKKLQELQLQVEQQQRTIAQLELEAGYLKEVIGAYKQGKGK